MVGREGEGTCGPHARGGRESGGSKGNIKDRRDWGRRISAEGKLFKEEREKKKNWERRRSSSSKCEGGRRKLVVKLKNGTSKKKKTRLGGSRKHKGSRGKWTKKTS